MYFVFFPVGSHPGPSVEIVLARLELVGQASAAWRPSASFRNSSAEWGEDALGLHLVRPPAPWRLIELECGQPVYVCPACWPALRRVLPLGLAITVREVVPCPRWAQCAVCEPDPVC